MWDLSSGISEVLTAFFFSHLAKAHLWPIFNTFLEEMFYVLSRIFNFFQKINAIMHGTLLVKQFVQLRYQMENLG